MSIADARAGLAEAIADTGLRGYARWPATVQTPAGIVVLTDGTYAPTFDGGMDATFLVVIVTQLVSVEKAQDDADSYLEETGSSSVAAAIRADPTLGGRVDVADVIGFTRYTPEEVDGLDRIVPAIQVEVKW